MNGSWRVALRLARRDVGAHRLRTVLTAALIGLPVLFAAALTALVLGTDDYTFALIAYLPLGLLIVLLAVPAFGVTARSRRDQLDLIESTGGTSTDTQRTVTAVGLVTGVIGVVGGLLLAVPVWLALVAVVNRLDEGQTTVASVGDLALWPLLAVIGLGASAIAARITAATLPDGGSGSDGTPSRVWFVIGIATAATGLGGVASVTGDSPVVAVWTTVLGIGVVLIVPTLVHLLGRVASTLPLAARLAARDADRHRMRTAPAIAAVMAGVAAVTALGIGSFSDNRDQRAEQSIYQLPIGATVVYASSTARMTDAVTAAEAQGVRFAPLGTPDGDQFVSVSMPAGVDDMTLNSTWFDVVVADADTVEAWGVRLGADAVRALEAGQALAGPTVDVEDGTVRARLEPIDADAGTGTPLEIPAVRANLLKEPVPTGVRSQLARLVIPPDLATSLGIDVAPTMAVVDRRDAKPSEQQLSALRDLPGVSVDVQAKDRFAGYGLVFTLLTLLGVGIVGLATATAVSLARLDGREDADTLVSVGARPSTSRWTAALSALLIGGLGSTLGVAVGLLPGLRAAAALTGSYGDRLVAVPWALLAVVGVGIPIAVAVIAFATASVRPRDASPGLR